MNRDAQNIHKEPQNNVYLCWIQTCGIDLTIWMYFLKDT